jgi:hypothetical protein
MSSATARITRIQIGVPQQLNLKADPVPLASTIVPA